MPGREGPALLRLPGHSASARSIPKPKTPTQDRPCRGAAAQLAALHRTLRHGPDAALKPQGARPAGAPRVPAANRTGLPERLKTGIEALSGLSMDDVKVHYGSSKPAQLRALAYTQGADIHVGPGQERHLAHEAWHVVQQKQGRVAATAQVRETGINDDSALEREADVKGAAALAAGARAPSPQADPLQHGASQGKVVQRVTKEQDQALRDRLKKDAFVSPTIDYPSDSSDTAIVNGKFVFRWIKLGHWRYMGKVPSKGKQGAFFGRVEEGSLSMFAQTALLDGDKIKGDKLAKADFGLVSFEPSSSSGGSRATGAAMGKYFFEQSAVLSANTYLLAPAQGNEWLHMRADSLGGDISPANLFAGGGSANSWMAAFEKAVAAVRATAKKKIVAKVHPLVDQSHHSDENCGLIVAAVNEQRVGANKKPLDKEAAKRLAGKESHKLKWLRYAVEADGKPVYTGDIDPATPGKFDKTLYEELMATVSSALLGQSLGPLDKLQTGKTAPVSTPSSSASSAFSTSSSFGSFSSFGSSSSFAPSPSASSSSLSSLKGSHPYLMPPPMFPFITSSAKSPSPVTSVPSAQPSTAPKTQGLETDKQKQKPTEKPQLSLQQWISNYRMGLLNELALLCAEEGRAQMNGEQVKPGVSLRIAQLRKLLDL
jgi:uncharacterized protein DUF4157